MNKQTDIGLVIKDFTSKTNNDDRFTSFDYCYNYFRSTPDLTKDIEKSCLVIGFYLASWGMFRGSSFLLQHSAYHFRPTIEYINTLDKAVWEIDVDAYDESNMQLIIEIYNEIKKKLIPNRNKDLTLVTKVMLGVFGFIPAFDNNFCVTFRYLSAGKCGFRSVNKSSLAFIHDFYIANKTSIDYASSTTFTTDFNTGKKTNIKYPRAKIIDMYGFSKSNFIKTETVFEIAGEGGSICIVRQKSNTEEKFIYEHSEFDPTDEDLEVYKKDVYTNFEEPFQLINDRYPWHLLYITTVHEDYKNYIIGHLLEKMNKRPIMPEYFDHKKETLENLFKIELSYQMINNEPTWSLSKLQEG